MIKKFHKLLLFLFLIITSGKIIAQEEDSVKTYQLPEITIKSGIILEPQKVAKILYNEVIKSDAAVLSELGKYIPSVKVQTNSRGETLFYLRGSNTRQVALFFDGVPLNIPWDNRIDLSQIPTEAIEEMNVTKGVPSIVYGANTPAGVINVNSKEYQGRDEKKISFQAGENNFQKYAGSILGGIKNFSYLATLSYNRTEGYNLPSSYSNETANPTKLRINSDREYFNGFLKLRYKLDELSNMGVSFSYLNSKKGVPPETAVASPRFWRYPEWEKITVGINGSNSLTSNAGTIFAYSLSASKFSMQIDQYKDISYNLIDDIEKGRDRIFYGRLILTQMIGNTSLLKLSAGGFTSSHIESFLSGGYQEFEYSQNVISAGAEYEYISDRFKLLFGTSMDGSFTPLTGNKPAKKGTLDYSFSSALVYSIKSVFSAQLNFGRKPRFPTLRESFSGALGRFIPNPELKPEVSYNGELNFMYKFTPLELDFAIFTSHLQNGIVRSVKTINGIRKFKRENKEEIRNYGIELNLKREPANNFSLNFNFTYLNSFGKNSAGEYTDTLEYKPNFIGGLHFDYFWGGGFNSLAEIFYVGEEYGLKEGFNYFHRLPDYFLINFRFAYSFKLSSNTRFEPYLRINNILDKLYYTQWSLPEAGRQFWIGVNAEF